MTEHSPDTNTFIFPLEQMAALNPLLSSIAMASTSRASQRAFANACKAIHLLGLVPKEHRILFLGDGHGADGRRQFVIVTIPPGAQISMVRPA